MDKQLYEALKTIKEHCTSQKNTCVGCPLDTNPTYGCMIDSNTWPEDWDIEQFKQEVSEECVTA